MKPIFSKLMLLLVSCSLLFAVSCGTKEPTTASPQVIKAQVVNTPPQYFQDSAVFSPVQRGILAAYDSTDTPPVVVQVTFAPPIVGEGVWSWMSRNWWAFLVFGLAVWELFARVTPTEVDNTVLAVLRRILDLFITNKSLKGGTHAA